MMLDWQIVTGACTIMSLVVTGATVYLRLYIGSIIHTTRNEILADMRINFVQKETHRPEMHEIKKAIARGEAHIERLTDRVNAVEIALARNRINTEPTK